MLRKGLFKPTQTFTTYFSILLLLSSCIGKNDIAIKVKNPRKKETFTSQPVTVSNVQVVNHQIIITGTNLASVSQFQIKEGSTNTNLQIESQTSTSIVANTISNVTFSAGKILDFIFTNAEAAATFTVNFSLCDSTLGGKAFNCTLTPNDKEVLSYDAASGKWQPRAVNGLSYIGSYDASSGANPAIKPAGQYYIISVAGDMDAGATILGVGDWIVSNGTAWQKIDNSTAIISVHGRTGAVVGDEGDYSLTQLSDVTITAPVNNQILKYNGTTWVNSDLSALGGGTVTSVSGTAPISVTNGTSTPAISISQATTTTNGYLSSVDWNTFNDKQAAIAAGTTAQYYRGDKSWQTLDTLAVPENTNLYFTNARALGVPLTGFSATNSAITAADSIFSAIGKAQGQIDNLTSGGANYIVKNGNDTVTGVVNFNTVGALSIGYTPTNMTDATSKSYVDAQRDSRVNKTGDTMTGDLQINTSLKLKDNGSNTVSLQAPTTITSSYVLKLPTALGSNNQVLTTDAAGNLSWTSPATSTAPNGSAGGDLSGSYPNPTITALSAAKIGGGAVDNTEFSYLDGVTSSIQTQLNAKLSSYTETDPGVTAFAKAALPTCNAGEVLKANGTVLSCVTDNAGDAAFTGTQNKLVLTDGSTGALTTSSVSNVEAGYLSGVTSNIQTQLNAKQATISKTTDQDVRSLRIYGANPTNYVELTTGTLTSVRTLSFPDSNGSSGNVLSTNGSGVLSWVPIPSAPVTSVHGRTSAVVSANGDYTASQVTNINSGNIAATTVQAAINELDSEKQNISTFADDVRGVVLTGLSTATNAVIDAPDSILAALGKLQAQISGNTTALSTKADRTNTTQTITALAVTGLSAPSVGADATNKTYVDAQIAGAANQWTLNGGNVYRSSGNVGIGIAGPLGPLHTYSADNTTYFETSGTRADVEYKNPTQRWRVGLNADGGATGNWVVRDITGSVLNALIVKPGGNVGIGITNPLLKLDTHAAADISNGNHDVLRVGDGTNGVRLGWLANGTSVTSTFIRSDNSLPLSLGTTSNIASGGAMTILNNGNIGVGTTNPQYLFEVNTGTTTSATSKLNGLVVKAAAYDDGVGIRDQGVALQSGWAGIGFNRIWNNGNYSIGNGYASLIQQDPAGNHVDFLVWGSASANYQALTGGITALSIQNSTGNVGIGGVTNPDHKLVVGGNARVAGNSNYTLPITTSHDLVLETAATNRKLYFAGNSNGYSIQSNEASTGNNIALTLNPLGGNVGIGVVNPGAALDVNGYSNSGGIGVARFRNSFNSGGSKFWQIGPDGNGSGNFLVYNDANVGAFITYGQTAWSASSDRRQKKQIEPIEDGLNKVLQLNGVTYLYKKDRDTDPRKAGLIAQDVQKVLPEAVTENGGFLAVKYTELIGLLVESIKDFYHKVMNRFDNQDRAIASKADKVEIDSLKVEIQTKDRKIKELEKRLEKIEQALSRK